MSNPLPHDAAAVPPIRTVVIGSGSIHLPLDKAANREVLRAFGAVVPALMEAARGKLTPEREAALAARVQEFLNQWAGLNRIVAEARRLEALGYDPVGLNPETWRSLALPLGMDADPPDIDRITRHIDGQVRHERAAARRQAAFAAEIAASVKPTVGPPAPPQPEPPPPAPVKRGKKPSAERQTSIIGAIREKGEPMQREAIRVKLGHPTDGSLGRDLAWMAGSGKLLVKIPGEGYWLAGEQVPTV